MLNFKEFCFQNFINCNFKSKIAQRKKHYLVIIQFSYLKQITQFNRKKIENDFSIRNMKNFLTLSERREAIHDWSISELTSKEQHLNFQVIGLLLNDVEWNPSRSKMSFDYFIIVRCNYFQSNLFQWWDAHLNTLKGIDGVQISGKTARLRSSFHPDFIGVFKCLKCLSNKFICLSESVPYKWRAIVSCSYRNSSDKKGENENYRDCLKKKKSAENELCVVYAPDQNNDH